MDRERALPARAHRDVDLIGRGERQPRLAMLDRRQRPQKVHGQVMAFDATGDGDDARVRKVGAGLQRRLHVTVAGNTARDVVGHPPAGAGAADTFRP